MTMMQHREPESIHKAPWPSTADFAGVPTSTDMGVFDLAVKAMTAINRAKTTAGVGVGRAVERLVLGGRQEELQRLTPVLADVLAAGRVATHTLHVREDLDEGVFEVIEMIFEQKPEKGED